MTPTEQYLQQCETLAATVGAQGDQIRQAAEWCSDSIADGRLVHVFGTGHSRILVEEMWPRYGSFPGFNPIVELSLTFHNLVVGANGQRQAMFLENVSGLAAQILRNFDLSTKDTALVVSSSGCSVVTIEMAQQFRDRGIRVIAIVGQRHSDACDSRHPDGVKLSGCADLVLDTGVPPGDAMVAIEGLDTPVSPGSTVGGVMLINALKAEIAERLVRRNRMPPVLTAGCLVGSERSAMLFESAYDEHAHRMATLYAAVGSREPHP